MHQLIYRGVTYNYAPSAAKTPQHTSDTVHPSYKLRYRGTVYSVDPNVEVERSIFHPIANLMYRGVAYSLNG